FFRRVPKCARWSLEMFEDFPANALTIYKQNRLQKKIILETGIAYRKRLDDYNERYPPYQRRLNESSHNYAPNKFVFEIAVAQRPGRLCLHDFSAYVNCRHPRATER
ncbi:hypothetical protein AAVH_31599, partial [Aphelenchoides avenae]